MTDKTVHITSAVLSIMVCIIAILWQPDLIKDAPSTLSTIGTFATAFGVIFAIIELKRAKAASSLAKEEAQRVLLAVTSLTTAREIIECQNTINVAVASLDEGRAIPTSVLCQIIRLYSQVFHSELVNEASFHRQNRSTVESYAYNPNIKSAGSSSRKTKQALLSISGQLAELQGSTKNFTEYTNDT